MGLAGKGVLAIWNGIAEDAEAEFLAWHVREHIPERVGVPGFLRARRYIALRGHPKYFNFYETVSPDDLGAPAYLARLNDPSDWTRKVVRHFSDTSRTVCRVMSSSGMGDGAFVATLRLAAAKTSGDPQARFESSVLEPLGKQAGIVGVHLLQGETGAGGEPTAEKALRSEPDRMAAWILLVEAVEAAPLDDFLDGLQNDALAAAGFICPEADRGIYRLQYALGREQLADVA